MIRRLSILAVAISCLLFTSAKCPECHTEIIGNAPHHAKHYPLTVHAQRHNVCRVTIVTTAGKVHPFSGVYLGEGRVLTCYHPFTYASGRIGCAWVKYSTWAKIEQIDPTTDQVLLKVDKLPPSHIEGVKLASEEIKLGEHLYSLGYDSANCKFECQGGTAYEFSDILNMGQHKPSVEFVGRGRNGDSGGPTFNSKGELIGVLWGTGYNHSDGRNSIAVIRWQATEGFFYKQCGIWGRRWCRLRYRPRIVAAPVMRSPPYQSDVLIPIPSDVLIPIPSPGVTEPEPEKPGPIPVPIDNGDELVPLPGNGNSPPITINELEVDINVQIDAEFYNKLANALINIEQGKPDAAEDPCSDLAERLKQLEEQFESNKDKVAADPRIEAIATNIVQIEQKLENMQGSGEKDPRIDQLVADVAELKAKLEGLQPGSGVDSRVDGILAELADLKRRMTANEAKPVQDPRVAAIANNLVKIEQQLAAMASTPCEDARFDQIVSRLDAIEARLAGLENDETLQDLIQELRILEKRLVDLQVSVDNLQDNPAQPGQDSRLQIIYLTSVNNPNCRRTDEKVSQLRESGYDYLRVVVLATHEVSVSDVPRLVIFPGKEVVRGEANVLVYLTQLVR